MCAIETEFPVRLVIEGVPEIGFHKHLCPFPGSLYSCLEFLNDPYPYDFLMGVSGAAFRRLWRKDDGGNVDLMYFGSDPMKRAFYAIGYQGIPISCRCKDDMIHAVKTSIVRNVPLLAFGIVGPPECGIVTGYDHDGEVLIGYSYFQGDFNNKYYEQPSWFENANWIWDTGMVVIGDKHPKPDDRHIIKSALKWIRELARTPRWADHACGLKAYDAWANDMLIDTDFPNDEDVLKLRVMVHGDAVVMLIERHIGACFLRKMAESVPEISDELNCAADMYDAAADTMPGIWMWESNMGPEVGQALRDSSVRRGISESIRDAGDKEEKAVRYIEKAIEKLK